jgi:aconitate decarboxylase
MQAHTEGSPLLALQMGFNARNAVVACDLATAGFEGPENILEGPFGYFRLIEQKGNPGKVAATLGHVWRVTELAHKPWPSGRATHGVMDACFEMKAKGDIDLQRIETITATVPPLIHHLVGRPFKPDMDINYARLCVRYAAARVLASGALGLADFTPAKYAEPLIVRLAQCMTVDVRDTGDPNALVPIEVEIVEAGGRRHTARVETVLGNPARPLSREAHLAKFRSNAAAALAPLSAEAVEALITMVDGLESLTDVGSLADLVAGPGQARSRPSAS